MIFPLAHLAHALHTIHDIFDSGGDGDGKNTTAQKETDWVAQLQKQQEEARKKRLVAGDRAALQRLLFSIPPAERARAQGALNSCNPQLIRAALVRVRVAQIIGPSPSHELRNGDRERGGDDGFGR